MKRKSIVLLSVLLATTLTLLGCGKADTITEEDAVAALTALFDGDIETANQYFCEEGQWTEEGTEALEGFQLQAVSCAIDEENQQMYCSTSVVFNTGLIKDGEELVSDPLITDLQFDISSGLLCPVDE